MIPLLSINGSPWKESSLNETIPLSNKLEERGGVEFGLDMKRFGYAA